MKAEIILMIVIAMGLIIAFVIIRRKSGKGNPFIYDLQDAGYWSLREINIMNQINDFRRLEMLSVVTKDDDMKKLASYRVAHWIENDVKKEDLHHQLGVHAGMFDNYNVSELAVYGYFYKTVPRLIDSDSHREKLMSGVRYCGITSRKRESDGKWLTCVILAR